MAGSTIVAYDGVAGACRGREGVTQPPQKRKKVGGRGYFDGLFVFSRSRPEVGDGSRPAGR